MKNWKGIFKIFAKRRPRRIDENIRDGDITEREMQRAQLDGEVEQAVDRESDDVYARCGEVFNST